jgi:hypothetical protein
MMCRKELEAGNLECWGVNLCLHVGFVETLSGPGRTFYKEPLCGFNFLFQFAHSSCEVPQEMLVAAVVEVQVRQSQSEGLENVVASLV